MPDNNPTGRGKNLLFATLVPSFYLTEWALVAITASAFTWLRLHDFTDQQIWLLFWGANLCISAGFILCNDLLQVDLTLMQGLRKLTERAARRSKWVGIPLEMIIFVRLLLWDGPCQLLIFFRRRIPSPPAQALFFLATSGIQMFVWAKLYTLGYDSVSELFTR